MHTLAAHSQPAWAQPVCAPRRADAALDAGNGRTLTVDHVEQVLAAIEARPHGALA